MKNPKKAYKGQKHHSELLLFTVAIEEAIGREIHFWSKTGATNKLNRFKKRLAPVLRSAGVAQCISYLERVCPNGKSDWARGDEYENFRLIRHCAVHNYGFLLPNRAAAIRETLSKLKAGKIKDREGNVVPPYYDIDMEGRIILNSLALHRCKVLCMEFLAHNGLANLPPTK